MASSKLDYRLAVMPLTYLFRNSLSVCSFGWTALKTGMYVTVVNALLVNKTAREDGMG